jgi:hypothetical protein
MEPRMQGAGVKKTLMFCPHTGKPRHPSDIAAPILAAAKTPAQRKADERQRHKEAGRTAVTVHVRPEYVPEVRALEAKLQRRENRKRGPAP